MSASASMGKKETSASRPAMTRLVGLVEKTAALSAWEVRICLMGSAYHVPKIIHAMITWVSTNASARKGMPISTRGVRLVTLTAHLASQACIHTAQSVVKGTSAAQMPMSACRIALQGINRLTLSAWEVQRLFHGSNSFWMRIMTIFGLIVRRVYLQAAV